jgi:hypothetical protein
MYSLVLNMRGASRQRSKRIDCPALFQAASTSVLPLLCALDQELGALLIRRPVVPRCLR